MDKAERAAFDAELVGDSPPRGAMATMPVQDSGGMEQMMMLMGMPQAGG